MHIAVNNSATQVTLTFTPTDSVLVYQPEQQEWTLNHLIDRSYKGKDADIGLPVVHLTEEQAQVCKNAGFAVVHYAIT